MSSPVNAPGRSPRARAITWTLGVISLLLYVLLFLFSDQINAFAVAAREGEKLYALIPLAIAMVFSFVHGAFTGHFWDLLGLRAKK